MGLVVDSVTGLAGLVADTVGGIVGVVLDKVSKEDVKVSTLNE